MNKTGLVWFRNDLRIHDQKSIARACETNDSVLGLYCFDPRHYTKDRFGFKKTEKFRAQFLLETVTALKANLDTLHIPLITMFEKPENTLPDIIKKYNITTVYFQKEWTTEEVAVLDNLRSKVNTNVKWIDTYDQFLYHPEDIPYEIDKIPRVFTGFRKKCEKYADVRPFTKVKPMRPETKIAITSNIPTLKEFGFTAFKTDTRTAFPFQGGENAALERLHNYVWETKKLSYYKKTRNGLIGQDYSSKFSPWLANGSLSAKMIYHEVKKYEKEVVKNDSTYWLIFELIWRDFFKYISLKHKNAIFLKKGILNKTYDWNTSQKMVSQWIEGLTLESFVNANMLELKNTGWMSNRGRQNVASYFAKNMKLDWRIGAAYFESMLLDYDVHSNYGNWMYVAGVGNDPRDRKFNVKLQAERYDANHKFQNMWLQTSLF